MTSVPVEGFTCPLPHLNPETVLLAHGGGGRLMQRLLEREILSRFRDPALAARHDGALLPEEPGALVFTTDSYVVKPIEFPGGDIGSLAVHGTVNDLAMCGARPVALSLALILEEGLPLACLRRILDSVQATAAAAGVAIVTGDTKVVDRGKADGIFINTAGVGRSIFPAPIAPAEIRPGDAILLSGDVGRHGVAIMASREGLEFETTLESDCANLFPAVAALHAAGVRVRCLRDCTRGGLGSVLIELAETSGLGADIRESDIPVCAPVRGACELLGLDPLYVANEGRFVAVVDAADAAAALTALRSTAVAGEAVAIGHFRQTAPPLVTLEGAIGSRRVLDLFTGEQLPRIC